MARKSQHSSRKWVARNFRFAAVPGCGAERLLRQPQVNRKAPAGMLVQPFSSFFLFFLFLTTPLSLHYNPQPPNYLSTRYPLAIASSCQSLAQETLSKSTRSSRCFSHLVDPPTDKALFVTAQLHLIEHITTAETTNHPGTINLSLLELIRLFGAHISNRDIRLFFVRRSL